MNWSSKKNEIFSGKQDDVLELSRFIIHVDICEEEPNVNNTVRNTIQDTIITFYFGGGRFQFHLSNAEAKELFKFFEKQKKKLENRYDN